jgi:hypothetical protein
MKNIVFILAVLLSSCTKVYKEVWSVERVPNQWDEEIVIPGEHIHYEDDVTCQWKCCYWEQDTFCWTHYDTITVIKFERIERIK